MQLVLLIDDTFNYVQLDVKWNSTPYANVITNPTLRKLFEENASSLGLQYKNETNVPAGSTDMGNVSYEVPSIHPFYYIKSDGVNHTTEFETASGKYKDELFCSVIVSSMILL